MIIGQGFIRIMSLRIFYFILLAALYVTSISLFVVSTAITATHSFSL